MKHIFVVGAFFTTNKQDTDVFPFVVNILKKQLPNVQITQPTDIENYRNQVESKNPNITLTELNKQMVDYDLNLIATSSLIIADVTNKSLGLGIELGIAKVHNVPIIFVARKNAQISNMVFGAFPYAEIHYYESLEDLETIITNVAKNFK